MSCYFISCIAKETFSLSKYSIIFLYFIDWDFIVLKFVSNTV